MLWIENADFRVTGLLNIRPSGRATAITQNGPGVQRPQALRIIAARGPGIRRAGHAAPMSSRIAAIIHWRGFFGSRVSSSESWRFKAQDGILGFSTGWKLRYRRMYVRGQQWPSHRPALSTLRQQKKKLRGGFVTCIAYECTKYA